MNKLLLFLLCSTSLMAQVVNYTESTAIIANPERGLQKYSKTGADYATSLGANNLSVATMNSWKTSADKVAVVYRNFLLDAFMNSNINTTYLSNMQGDFNNIKAAGLKVIVRFIYSEATGSAQQQPTKTQILAHISQLSSILHSNKDVIFSFQAGFVGTWGEWYYTNSTEFGTEGSVSEVQWANRKEIVDAMLAATPIEIPIQVRTPAIKIKFYGDTPLNDETAYQNTPKARVGFFNDSFLNNWGDLGTFAIAGICVNPVGTQEYSFLSNDTRYLPMSGETSGINSCIFERTKGDNAIFEMGLTNWTTINRDYNLMFWNQIIASSHYDAIVKGLGYRFVLTSSEVTPTGPGFDLKLNIQNVGFARPFKERNVFLVLKNLDNNLVTNHLLNTDVRTWETTVSINQSISVETPGNYQLYLWMPDINSELQGNSDYSIQLANEDVWDAATGYNDLKQTVQINETLSTPDIEKESYLVYPNPTNHLINIDFLRNDVKNVSLSLYNLKGQIISVSAQNHGYGLWKMDLSGVSSGIYLLKINADGKTTYKKIVVE